MYYCCRISVPCCGDDVLRVLLTLFTHPRARFTFPFPRDDRVPLSLQDMQLQQQLIEMRDACDASQETETVQTFHFVVRRPGLPSRQFRCNMGDEALVAVSVRSMMPLWLPIVSYH